MNVKQFENNLQNVKKYSPDVYKKTMQLTVPFFMLHKKLFDQGNQLLSDNFSLNQSELDILATLYYMSDGSFTLSPTQLYDVMFFSSGGMTKILKKLEHKELIRRIDDKTDKRSKLVQLTQKGKNIVDKALKEVVSFEDTYFNKLNKEEQETMKNLLLKILS